MVFLAQHDSIVSPSHEQSLNSYKKDASLKSEVKAVHTTITVFPESYHGSKVAAFCLQSGTLSTHGTYQLDMVG